MPEQIVYAALSAVLMGLVPAALKAGTKRTAPTVGAFLYAGMLTLYLVSAAASVGAFKPSALDARAWGTLAASGAALGLGSMCLIMALGAGTGDRVLPVWNLSTAAAMLLPVLFSGGAITLFKGIYLTMIVFGTVLMESGERNTGKRGWLIYAIAAAVLLTASDVLSGRVLDGCGPGWRDALCAGAAALLLLILNVAGGAHKTLPGMRAAGYIFPLLAGAASGLAALCMSYAASLGETGVLPPLAALALPAAFLFMRIVNAERASGASVLGMLLTLFGMVALTMDMTVLKGWLF